MAEAKKATGALFDWLDRDRDGTLDRRELRGRVDAKEAVDSDNDGTVSAAKLRTKAGRALLRLLVF
jgi:Ca2+-binding EF-hand superfamily protein